MNVIERNNIHIGGRLDGRPMLFAHGFGCDQNMWRFVTPAFERDHKIVLFDLTGAGGSDTAAFDPERYASLGGYADDVVEICRALELRDVVLVGHSVSSIIGALAVIAEPERFRSLVMVSPSPRYIDDEDYVGGFSAADIDELLDFQENNYLGWSSTFASVIMGTPDRPELETELEQSFCRTDPDIARHFARVTFTGDNRDDLPKVSVPTLVLQSAHDVIAQPAVGEYVHRALPDSDLVVLDAVGHCPNLSAPAETAAAIRAFLD